MKRALLLLAASAFVTPAFAADIIAPQPPAPAPMTIEPVTTTKTWTGIYVGGQAGAAFGNSDNGAVFDPGNNGAFNNGLFGHDNNAGFVGGAHVGYDYELSNGFVLGAVADINYIDGKEKRSYTVGGGTFSTESDLNYFGTVRGRLGYAFDSLLVYGSGGLAYAGVDNKTTYPAGGNYAGYNFRTSGDKADFGYSVGGGVDYLATQHLSFGVEYLYTNLGSNKQTITGTNGANTVSFSSNSNNNDLDFHTVWAKASYRFN
ncbi:outer membrane protein [Jiella sp. M17.18]|uniref:outer membrane protein n=1 Tax=Jiella sp. M17.18 TaxID=3234247 RepID=UPI0034E0063A